MRVGLLAVGWVGASLWILACGGPEPPDGSGGSGGTGGTPECVDPLEDCVPAVPDCQSLVGCIDGACAFENQPDGKVLSTQAEGDCAQVVCDGQGSTRTELAEDDVPSDGSECTEYACVDGMPMKTILPSIPCYTGPEGSKDVGECKGGMMVCNAMGLPEGACEGEVVPAAEMCAPIDANCDGQPDANCPP
jgi:hypothetical protein